MENNVSLQIRHLNRTTSIDVDNSTEFKDFSIRVHRDGKACESLDIQISKETEVCLEIGKFTLIGREVELLKEFLNQKL